MSGLEFRYLDKEEQMDMYVVEERLALTEDGRVVPEEDPAARWLYAIPGQAIALEEAKRYGLIKGKPDVAAEMREAEEEAKPAAGPAKKPAAKRRKTA